MNRNPILEKSKGQILVILSGVLVVLLGITALAIDGSLVYSDRRFTQNAADSAALAGAGMAAEYLENKSVRYETFLCSNPDVLGAIAYGESKAIARAASNDFSIDSDISDIMGVEISCHHINLGAYFDNYLNVRVLLNHETETSFAQLFFGGDMINEVESVVRVHPRTNIGMGYALASTGLDCSSGGMVMNGNIDINTTGAGIFSNSCMDFDGSALTVTADDPVGEGIRYYTAVSISGSPYIDPPPVQAPIRLPEFVIPPPDCGALPNHYGDVSVHGVEILYPGWYDSISMHNTGAEITLSPGLYCISDGVNINGGTIVGTDVTLYMSGGDFLVAGTVNVNLAAPTGDMPPAMRGMLIYYDSDGSITLQGTSTSSYVGTVYAPDGEINAGGNTSTIPTLSTQLIAKYVEVSGNSDITINFDSSLNYQVPASLDVIQ